VSYIPRLLDADLALWASSEDRKPLVLRGARQTGKTAAIRQLGRSFDLFVELNLDRLTDRRLVEESRTPAELLTALQVRDNVAQYPPRTLLFVDEVQESPKAVGWLRTLYEEHPTLAVVAAGSLLEVRAAAGGFSFPVGRVTFRYLHPLTFFEFLGALGRDVLLGHLQQAARLARPLPPPVHEQALDLLRDYLWVGGMPEAVMTWVSSTSPVRVRELQADLMQAFSEDIPKYEAGPNQGVLDAVFSHLPHHYGLRFKYESFAPGYRSALMKSGLAALEGAMLVRRALPTSDVQSPLHERPNAAPKLFPLDVGLASAGMAIPLVALRGGALDQLLDGRMAEVLVGQLLISRQRRAVEPLYFWTAGKRGSEAEVDFLVPGREGLLPIEVKAGAQGTLRALHQLIGRSTIREAVRLWSGPLLVDRPVIRVDGVEITYTLRSLPLYLAETAVDLPTTSTTSP
jgi:uncharacterized protein